MDDLWMDAAGAAGEGLGRLTAGGSGLEGLRDRNEQLERRLEKLSLVCQALWTLVRDKTGVNDDDLARRIQELDLRDGRLDGKAAQAVVCGACGRHYSKRRTRCLYCEAPRKEMSPFDTV